MLSAPLVTHHFNRRNTGKTSVAIERPSQTACHSSKLTQSPAASVSSLEHICSNIL